MRTALRSHRVLVAGALLLLVVGAVAAQLLWRGPRVEVLTVERRDLVRTIVASGQVQAPHRVEIGVQLTGTVTRVPVDEGQAVKAGQVLVELDPAEARATRAQADAAVQEALARLRQLREVQAPVAEQTVRQAEVTLANARSQFKRQQDLFAQGFIGEAALDDARKSVDLAEAQLQAAVHQRDSARPSGSDSALAETALAQARSNAELARVRLGYTTVAAPVAGTLIARDVEPGDVVQPGKALMVLSPAGETQLVVQVDEKNLRLLAVGQNALASTDAYPDQRFAARLVYINPGVDVQRGSVEVKLAVAQPPAVLRQDMTVSVDIEVARRPQTLVVASEAVHEIDGAHPWVLKVDGGRARRQPVRLGLRGNGTCEVLEGLAAGDRVVPAGSADLHEGSRLRAVDAAASR